MLLRLPSLPTALLLAALLGASALGACGGAPEPEPDPVPVPDPVMAEVALQCLDLLEEYRETDFRTASETELQRQMDEATANEELCSRALTTSYRGAGGEVMAHHLARELSLHALKAELTLSERFDDMAGYCAILEDIIRSLDRELTEVGEALTQAAEGRSDLDEADVQALVSLQNLSVQTVQVSLVDYRASCP